MIPRWTGRLTVLAGAASSLALAACGGGGGVASMPTPVQQVPSPTPTATPVPTPSPTPTPAPTGSTYDTAEYRATIGSVSMNALAAYQAGATGAGIKVGVVDTGLNSANLDQFAGRIDPASANVAGGSGYTNTDDHGTAVAFILAGARNGTGTQGVAFDSTLIVARADDTGSCSATGSDGEAGCAFDDRSIARGIDLAVANGARVINLSLGGSPAGMVLIQALSRATAAGVVVVIAAGNDSATNPDSFAEIANDAGTARNLIIIAGSVGANDARTAGADQISSFSDRAGDGAQHFLAAVGEDVRAPCEGTSVCLWTGTSFSAPQISGAAALLAQAFPNLTGAQIVDLLFRTARDAGASGVDPVYGQGVLDLTRAFQPVGTASVAGSRQIVSLSASAVLSSPMGDAATGQMGAVILDGFDRAFAVDLAQTIRHAAPQPLLTGALQSRARVVTTGMGNVAVAMTIAPTRAGIAVERTMLSPADADRARMVAGSVTTRLNARASFAVGFAQGSDVLGAQLQGRADPAFLIARGPAAANGFERRADSAVAFRQRLGAWGVTGAIETGAMLTRGDGALPVLDMRWRRDGYSAMALTLDRRLGPVAATLGATRLDERATLLGARLGSGLGGPRATTWFLDAGARADAGSGWSLGAAWRQGWTGAALHGLAGGGTIRTNAFAADVGKAGVIDRQDSWGLRVAQPLRVASGGLDITLPTNWNYASGSVDSWATQRLNLAPTGRELIVETRYAHPFGPGTVEGHLFWRRDPGNVATLPDDHGAALRYSFGF